MAGVEWGYIYLQTVMGSVEQHQRGAPVANPTKYHLVFWDSM